MYIYVYICLYIDVIKCYSQCKKRQVRQVHIPVRLVHVHSRDAADGQVSHSCAPNLSIRPELWQPSTGNLSA